MNPVKFKISSEDRKPMTEVKGMTVFNTEEVNTKKQPMFFGKPLGVQRYDNFKYNQFENLTKQQLGYFWRPEEVSLQKDRGDYQTLYPEQKHIYTSNLKYQIMAGSASTIRVAAGTYTCSGSSTSSHDHSIVSSMPEREEWRRA